MDDARQLFGHVDEVRTSLAIDGQKEGTLTVLAFHGRETLSALAGYVLSVGSSDETAAKLDDALGRDALFVIERSGEEGSRHIVRGVVAEVSPSGVTIGKNQRQTEIRIVPRVAELEHSRSSRVFQDVTVVDIAKKLFEIWQIDLDVRVHPPPLKRDYCTQANETDLDFLQRILSEEGIHFHVEHREDTSVVVFVNDPRGYEPIAGNATLPYRDSGGAITVDHVKNLRRQWRVRPGLVEQSDYNFLTPEHAMASRAETAKPNEPGSLNARAIYEYPGEYNAPDAENVGVGPDVQGERRSGFARSKMRLEAERSQVFTFDGATTSLRVRVGHTFEITDHADKVFNRKYIVTDIRLSGEKSEALWGERNVASSAAGSAGITVYFKAVPAETPIRPQRVPKPPAHLRTGRVVGPKADEPYVDEFGRIKVQFAWDREGKHDETSSCWIRMATPVAHHNQGSYVAHRVGAEVLVDFLDGDVDRPVVVGAVFHAENRQPQSLPDDATRAVLYRGLSVPGNKGYNEISCEDRAGQEEILVHAQRDMNEHVLRNHTETIGANQTSSIGANQTISVGANQTISVGANRTVSVKGDENIHITNSRHENVDDGESVTVTGGRSHTVATKDDELTVAAGNRSVSVKEMHKLVAKEEVVEVATTIDINAGTSIKIHHKGDSTLELKDGEASLGTASKIVLSNPSGTITLTDGKIQIAAAEELVLGSGGAQISLKKDGTIAVSGAKEVGIASGASSAKFDPKAAVVNGSAVNVTASGIMEISGAMVKIN